MPRIDQLRYRHFGQVQLQGSQTHFCAGRKHCYDGPTANNLARHVAHHCHRTGLRGAPPTNCCTVGDDYEVRDYAPHLMAKTTVPGGFDETGNTAFRRLEAMIPLSSCLAIRSQTVVAPFSGHARKGTAPERNQFVEER